MKRVGQVAAVGAVATVALLAVVGGASAAQSVAAGPTDTAGSVGAAGPTVSGTSPVRMTAANVTVPAATVNGTVPAATSHTNLSVLVAPGGSLSTLRNASAASNYSEVLTLRPRPTLADAMVVRVSAPGLADAVDSQPGNTTTDRFFALLGDDRASLRMYEVAPSEQGPFKAIDVTDPEAVTVVPGEGDRFDLVTDPAALNGTLDRNGDERPDPGGAPVGIESFDTYQFNFTFEGQSETIAISVFPTVATVAANEPNNRPRVFPAANQSIGGTTTVAPGTRLDIELVVRGERGFSRERTVTVTNRSLSEFTATFDLQDAVGARNISVVARLDGDPIGGADGRILDLSATLDAPDRSESREILRIPRANLSQGGFVIVRPVGSDRIVGKQYLSPGVHEDVSVSLVPGIQADALNTTLYVDFDGDRRFDGDGTDRPYRRPIGTVSTIVSLEAPSTPVPTSPPPTTTTRPPTTSATPPPTTTRPPTTGTTPPSGTTVDPVAGPETDVSTTFTPYTFTVESGPGFGVAAALAALVALGLLARRRSP
jgi:PGF-CTERM protein